MRVSASIPGINNIDVHHTFAVVGISCVPIIFHVAVTVSISWAAGAAAVVVVSVAIPLSVSAFVFAGRVVSATRRGRAIAASWRSSIASLTASFTAVTTLAAAATSSFVSPGSRRRSPSPLIVISKCQISLLTHVPRS